MSKSTKITYTRFVYSIIDFLATECQLPFDVSSYIQNDDNPNCRIANLRIGKFIQRYRKKDSKNKLFLTISFNDTKTEQKGKEIIQLLVDNILERFLNSSCIEILKRIDNKSFIEVFSTSNYPYLTDYLILVFNISNCSSIECIISTDSITSKLIERDEDGETIEFNSNLYANLKHFKQNLQ